MNKNRSEYKAIESFIEELLKKKGVKRGTKDYETQKQILLKEVSETIDSTLINSLKIEDVKKLNELLDKNPSDEEIQEFFKQKLPNLEEIVTKSMLEFARGYLSVK